MEGGPWGIVIVISAFMIQFFVFGVSSSIGVYNIEFLEYFKASASEVSLIAALNYGMFFASGPLVSFLMTRFAYREVVLGGCVVLVIGLLAIPLVPYLYTLYLGMGLLVGFGNSCAYIPSHTLTGLYYDKYRGLATAIATSGSGLSFAVMPLLTAWFIDLFGWKGSFIMLSGFTLHVFIFASLLRSPPATTTSLKTEENDDICWETNCDVIIADEMPDDTVDMIHDKEYSKLNIETPETPLEKDRESHSLLNNNEDTASHSQKLDFNTDRFSDKTGEKLPDSARHFHIFKNYNFVIFSINNYFWNAAAVMNGAFAPPFFSSLGFSLMEVSLIMGISGAGAFLGGILGGFLGNTKYINRTYLYVMACFLEAVWTTMLPLHHSFAYCSSIFFITGVTFGILLGLRMVVLSDLIGVESLGNGMGYLLLSCGIGTFTGPIFAGLVIDATQTLESGIYMAAITYFTSAVSMCFIPLHKHVTECCCKKATSTPG